jgi:ElaB/YqjD/DUF883 family membrane-anchored ribosome-binding protein
MKEPSSKLIEVPLEAVDAVQHLLDEVSADVEKQIAPVRTSILKRFPTLFLLAVTFGFSLVIYSIEVILAQQGLVLDHPWLSLGIGIGILTITGTLYRKLS